MLADRVPLLPDRNRSSFPVECYKLSDWFSDQHPKRTSLRNTIGLVQWCFINACLLIAQTYRWTNRHRLREFVIETSWVSQTDFGGEGDHHLSRSPTNCLLINYNLPFVFSLLPSSGIDEATSEKLSEQRSLECLSTNGI